MSFTHHPFGILAGTLSGHRSFDNCADRGDVLLEVYVAFFRNQRRISCNSVCDSKSCSLANLIKVGSIKKKLHKNLQVYQTMNWNLSDSSVELMQFEA